MKKMLKIYDRVFKEKAVQFSYARPDFNIDKDSFHTPKSIIEASVEYFESKGFH